MRVEVSGARELGLSVYMREYLHQRLHFAVGRFVARITRVRVRLAPNKGPRGREELSCQLRVELPGLEPVIVSASDPELRAAIDGAADRVGRTVARSLERARGALGSRR